MNTELEIILKAAKFAALAHHGQLRKYTGEPYIVHPLEVAKKVASVTDDYRMICAALLHDVVEDTVYTSSHIHNQFGSDIGNMVDDLTDQYSHEHDKRPRIQRKADECARIALISPEAKTIKLADIICNTGSIVQHDPKFAKVYMAEKRALLIVLKDGNPKLWMEAYSLCE